MFKKLFIVLLFPFFANCQDLAGSIANLIMQDSVSKQIKNYDQYVLEVLDILTIYKNPSLEKAFEIQKKYPWFPNIIILNKIEKSVNHLTAPNTVLELAKLKKITHNNAKFFLLHANFVLGKVSIKNNDAQELIRYLWRNTEFSVGSEEYILNNYKNIFSLGDLLAKIDFLIWNNNLYLASKLSSLLPASKRLQAEKKLKLAKAPYTAESFTNSDEDFIIYNVINNYIKSKQYNKALKNILSYTPKSNFNKWWKLKNVLIRELLSEKQYVYAYNLTLNHRLK